MKLGKIYLFVLLLAGCQSVVHLNGDGLEPLVVLNSVLEVGKDSTSVQISLTQPVGDKPEWAKIQTATVTLFENGNPVGSASPAEPGYYVFKHMIKPSTTYRIEAEVPDYNKVWGETHTPGDLQETNIDIRFDTKKKHYEVNVSWKDIFEENNYYWFGARCSYYNSGLHDNSEDTTRLIREALFYSNSSLIDPFNRTGDDIGDISTCYEYYIRVEDSGFDGQLIKLPFMVTNNHDKFVTFMLSVDSHYDAWLKSSIQNKENYDMIEDLPLLYQPAYTHSNIHGGVGLVGSFISVEKSLSLSYAERYPWAGSSGGASD